MAANSSTGVLDSCKCRVSIRKEEKGGKNFRKVDFLKILNISTLFVRLALWTLIWPSMLGQVLQLKDTYCRCKETLDCSISILFVKSLQAYDTSHRLDNSLLQITLNITLRLQNNLKYNAGSDEIFALMYIFWHVLNVCFSREGDLVFSRPLTRTQVRTTQQKTKCWTFSFAKKPFQPILLPGEEDRGLPLLRESPLSLDPTSPPR